MPPYPINADKALNQDVRRIIEAARTSVAASVNAELTMLQRRIVRRVRQGILQEGRAPCGDAIVSTLSGQLRGGYGREFYVQMGWVERWCASAYNWALVFPSSPGRSASLDIIKS